MMVPMCIGLRPRVHRAGHQVAARAGVHLDRAIQGDDRSQGSDEQPVVVQQVFSLTTRISASPTASQTRTVTAWSLELGKTTRSMTDNDAEGHRGAITASFLRFLDVLKPSRVPQPRTQARAASTIVGVLVPFRLGPRLPRFSVRWSLEVRRRSEASL